MARGSYDPRKQALAKSIRLDIPNVPFGVGHCVYKLHYGDKYIIRNGENLAGSLFMLQNGYAYHVAYKQKESDDKANKLYISFYKYLQAHPGLQFRLEILLESTSPYEILKTEQLALNAAIKDKNCLNTNLQSYLPKWRPKQKKYGGWISSAHMMNYKKFLKSL